jgi:hypothetical protein
MVHGGAGKEIASVMEIYVPNSLGVVFVGGNAGVIGDIPKLYIGISAGSEQVQSFGMELHCTHPLLVPLSRHYQFSLGHGHELEGKVVARSGKHWFFRVEIDASDGHVMGLPCLVKHCVFVLEGSDLLLSVRVLPFLRRKWGKLYFFLASFIHFLFSIAVSLGNHRGRSALVYFFLYLGASFETVSFQLDQHLFFHEVTVLFSLFVILLLEDDVVIPQFLQVVVQLLLLLLHPLVVHLVEALLFEQFLVCAASLFGHDYRLVQLLLQTTDLVLQLLVLLVLYRNLFNPLQHHALLDQLVPFLLEVVESLWHLVLYEEVSQEEVDGLALGVHL